MAAAAALRVAWGHTARSLHLGATQPGRGLNALDAAGLEALMTAALVLMIFFFTSHARTARWTPLGNWLLVATLVWQGAPYTGTSLNPARSIGPALLAPQLADLWVYLAGPLAGALLAVAVFAACRNTPPSPPSRSTTPATPAPWPATCQPDRVDTQRSCAAVHNVFTRTQCWFAHRADDQELHGPGTTEVRSVPGRSGPLQGPGGSPGWETVRVR